MLKFCIVTVILKDILIFVLGHPPDFDDAIILRSGVSVKHVCHSIHRTLEAVFKYALVWVSSIHRTLWFKLQFCHVFWKTGRCSFAAKGPFHKT